MIDTDDMNYLKDYMYKIQHYIEPGENDAIIFTAVSAIEKGKIFSLIKGGKIAVQAAAMNILRQIYKHLDNSEKENFKAAINYLIFKENKKKSRYLLAQVVAPYLNKSK